MQVEHKTEKGVILFFKVPEDASDLTCPKIGMVDLYFKTKITYKDEEDNYISIALPDVGFQLIGLTNDIREEQAKMMVDDDIQWDRNVGFIDYTNRNKVSGLSAIDSFKSLMKYLEVYDKHNPFYLDHISQWYDAQSRAGKWVVLFKPNNCF